MEDTPIKKGTLLLFAILSLVIVALIFIASLKSKQTAIVFCDVGQGDGIYMRIHNHIDIVIDSGPNKRILSCLGKHMPFYDRTLEYIVVTNPDQDHFNGFNYILPRYQVKNIVLPPMNKSSNSFELFKKQLLTEKATLIFPKATQQLTIDHALITFYWPTEAFAQAHLNLNKMIYQVETKKLRNFNSVLGETDLDENDFSLVFLYEEGSFDILFTGDASPLVLNNLMHSKEFIRSFSIHTSDRGGLDILKVPHHGSRNGLTSEFLMLADPTLSVISVGKNNKYHHPSKEILDMLKASNYKYLRTDEKGDIVMKIPKD